MRKKLSALFGKFPELKIAFSLSEWETDFLRFFQSMTNYNISKQSISLHTTIYQDKKSYSFDLKDPKIEQVEAKIAEAQKIIPNLPADPDFVDLEDDSRIAEPLTKSNNIQLVDLEQKTAILKHLSQIAAQYNFKIFGTFICNYSTQTILNSNGVDKKQHFSPIYFECKAVSDANQVTVLEVFGGEDFSKFQLEKFAQSLEEKMSAASSEVVDVPAGKYDVILAPRCIGEYFRYLSGSMEAAALDNGQSFFEGKIDGKVFPENITLTDSPLADELINFSYNPEGHLYQTTPIIENGVFKNFLVGNYYGRKLKLTKNGAEGMALVLQSGDKTLAEMISGIKHGLYISSLHYMNFINPKETSVTGLTRDGTFLIEDGKITKVVNNLRFTEKISDIISEIYALENQNHPVPFSSNYGEFEIVSFSMPHVAVKNFQITSSTQTI
ncbi:MAG: TldD/PmbA family protein [Candidatus Cloacimonadales bacterium]